MRRAIAIDFDGCICQSKYPEIGEPNWHVIEEAKKEQEERTMPKYLVMLRCSRARSNANRHRQETPTYLPYRIEAPKALDAADKAKEEAALYYPQYQKIQVDSVTEVRDL